MCKKNDYIQLPPIPSETDPDVVKMIWESMQLQSDKQEKETARLKTDCTAHGDEASTKDEEEKHISSVGDKEAFGKAVKESLAGIIMEISEFICWLYRQADQQEENIEDIISEHPEIADLLKTLSTVFGSMRSASDREDL